MEVPVNFIENNLTVSPKKFSNVLELIFRKQNGFIDLGENITGQVQILNKNIKTGIGSFGDESTDTDIIVRLESVIKNAITR